MIAEAELARAAFDGIFEMKRANSAERLEEVASRLFADLGLPHFALARFFDANRACSTKVILGQFEPAWASRYVAKSYGGRSRIAGEMLISAAPYSWSEVIKKRGIDPAQRKIWSEARSFGLHDGLFTPVKWNDGSYAAVVLAGSSPSLNDPLVRTMSEVLSAYYAGEARRLLTAPAIPPAALSPRQRECLAWVRHGHSSSSIGAILGISVQTVDEHVAEACRKLGVRTRVQAAVEACLAGLID